MPSLPRTRLKMHCQGPPAPCVHRCDPIDRDVDPVKVRRSGWQPGERLTREIESVARPLPMHRGCKAWRDHRRSIFSISSSHTSRYDLWIKISTVNKISNGTNTMKSSFLLLPNIVECIYVYIYIFSITFFESCFVPFWKRKGTGWKYRTRPSEKPRKIREAYEVTMYMFLRRSVESGEIISRHCLSYRSR